MVLIETTYVTSVHVSLTICIVVVVPSALLRAQHQHLA